MATRHDQTVPNPTPMLAPLTPGDDPRFVQLLQRLPDLGVPLLPLDHERICRVFPKRRVLGWEAARELLVALLAKDEDQRRTVRSEFGRSLPPKEEQPAPGAEAGLTTESNSAAAGDTYILESSNRGIMQSPGEADQPAHTVWTPRQRRWPVLWLALGTALVLIALLPVLLTLHAPKVPNIPIAGPTTSPVLPPGLTIEPPTQPPPKGGSKVPVSEGPALPDLLIPWLGPLAFLGGGLLACAWLWERARRLLQPAWSRVAYKPEGEPVFAWSPEYLRLPGLLSAKARRELVWGVNRFASERTTTFLDIPATVHASAATGLPEACFTPARYEREVWLWLDTQLRSREAVSLAEQIEHDLVRAGLSVRRATFVGWPDQIRLATRERVSPMDLGPAARQALVCVFTDGIDLARALDQPAHGDTTTFQRALRELRTWPRLCLVDLAPPECDLRTLAAHLGLECCPPAALPAWLAERPDRPRRSQDEGPVSAGLGGRIWAAACALPRLPVTTAQALALHETLGKTLGLPPVWRLPALGHDHSSPDGIRYSDRERHALLRDLARWVTEDGWGTTTGPQSDACRCLAQALAFWDGCIAGGAASLARISKHWNLGPGDQAQTIERLLLALWWGDERSALAVRSLYDIYQQKALQPLIRERLAVFTAPGLPSSDGAICLPWTWQSLPEVLAEPAPANTKAGATLGLIRPILRWMRPHRPTDQTTALEPHGTARQRLRLMGFGGTKPSARPTLGADTLLMVGACAGLALAGGIAIVERLGVPRASVLTLLLLGASACLTFVGGIAVIKRFGGATGVRLQPRGANIR